ncbi:MAG: NADH-quinone oxidoreductase subunit A, partial [Conexivisphaerales archaeon]
VLGKIIAELTGWGGVYLDVIVTLLIGLAVPVLSYVVGATLYRGQYTDKRKRFESGNKEEGRGRGMFMMQYYSYALIFMASEPAFVILFVFLLLFNYVSYTIFIFGVLIYVPALVFSTMLAREIKKWMISKD